MALISLAKMSAAAGVGRSGFTPAYRARAGGAPRVPQRDGEHATQLLRLVSP
jgi:hypothetical protein